jgi:hypothetical protein
MHRTTRQDDDAPGHDSFLDIVANMVGILIILVMVMGVRVKNAPRAAILGSASQLAADLQKDLATEQSLREVVLGAEDQIRSVRQETLGQRRNRDVLAVLVSALEQEIQTRRERMDGNTQRLFDLRRGLSQSRLELDQLERQRAQAEDTRPEPIVVESYPTPLSETVSGREAHFQLRGGRIALVPLESLVDLLKQSAERQKYKLLEAPELTDTVGPVGGFQLRYTLERYDVSAETAVLTGRSGSYARLRRWTLIPLSNQSGEPVDVALAEGSEFRQALSKLRPGQTVITIWTYQDSFASFRRIKKELYGLGFSVAARPLPLDIPISGSPEGSRSAAE